MLENEYSYTVRIIPKESSSSTLKRRNTDDDELLPKHQKVVMNETESKEEEDDDASEENRLIWIQQQLESLNECQSTSYVLFLNTLIFINL